MIMTVSQGVQSLIGQTKYLVLDRHYSMIVRVVLVAICLALSVVSAALLVLKPTFAVLGVAGFAGVGVIIYMYRHMEISTLLLIVVSTVLNVGVGTGTGTDITFTLMLLLLLTGLWLVRLFLADRSLQSVRGSMTNWAALAFVVAVIFAMIWSSYYVEPHVRFLMADKWKPRMMTMLVLLISPIATLLVANHVRSLNGIKFFVWYFVVVGAISSLPRILIGSTPLAPIWNTRGQLPVWVIALAAGQLLFNPKVPNWLRGFCLLGIGGWGFIQFGLDVSWLSGWVPICIVLGVVIVMYSWRVTLFMGLMIVILALANMDTINQILADESEESGGTRVEAWTHTLDIASGHLLFGTGPTGYYFYLTVDIGGLFQLSHNNYLDIVSQTGLFGFVTFMAFWISIGRTLWKIYCIVPPDTFQYGLFVSLLASWLAIFVVMALGDWVTPFTYTQTLSGISYTIWPWLLMGLVIALYYHLKDAQEV